MIERDCSGFEGREPFVAPKPMSERRVAILSTAALNMRGDAIYERDATDFRVIPGDVDPADVVLGNRGELAAQAGGREALREAGGRRRASMYIIYVYVFCLYLRCDDSVILKIV